MFINFIIFISKFLFFSFKNSAFKIAFFCLCFVFNIISENTCNVFYYNNCWIPIKDNKLTFNNQFNSVKLDKDSKLSSIRQLRVSQGYGDSEYNKFNLNIDKSLKQGQEAKNSGSGSEISKNSRLSSVRQMRLAQRYGDPEYEKFSSSSIMRFYGFVGYELIFITRQEVIDYAIGEYVYPAQYYPDINNKDINAHGQTIMDAAGSRIGIFFNPFQNGGLDNIYGIIEFDFRGTIQLNQYTAKIRHSFGEIAWKGGSFLFGQYYHPLFLAESFPRVVNYNLAAPFEPQCICPQVRVTQMWGPCEFMFTLAGQSFLANYGPPFPSFPSNSFIENAIVPNVNFEFKWRIGDSFYGFSLDYLRIVPRLSSTVTSEALGTITFKVNEQVNSINAELFLHNVFKRGEINFNFLFTQNGSNQLLISSYAIKSVNDFTGARTYIPTNAIAVWMDAFCLFFKNSMNVGLFLGYTMNLGAFQNVYINPTTGQPELYSLESNAAYILYLYRMAPRYVYDIGSFRIGVELQWDLVAYGAATATDSTPLLNQKALPVDPIAVNNFSPIIVLEYPF